MDASTATPGSPQDDASLSTLSSRPRPRRYRRKKHSMGRGFDAFLASKASKLAEGAATRACRIAKSTRPRPRREATRPCANESARIYFAMWRQGAARAPDGAGGDAEPGEARDVGLSLRDSRLCWSSKKIMHRCPSTPSTYRSTSSTARTGEWITAIVRSVLLHNIDHFAHKDSAIEKGDKYFMGGRAETIFKTAVTVRPPKLYGPETLPRLPESDSESSEGKTFSEATSRTS